MRSEREGESDRPRDTGGGREEGRKEGREKT